MCEFIDICFCSCGMTCACNNVQVFFVSMTCESHMNQLYTSAYAAISIKMLSLILAHGEASRICASFLDVESLGKALATSATHQSCMGQSGPQSLNMCSHLAFWISM